MIYIRMKVMNNMQMGPLMKPLQCPRLGRGTAPKQAAGSYTRRHPGTIVKYPIYQKS